MLNLIKYVSKYKNYGIYTVVLSRPVSTYKTKVNYTKIQYDKNGVLIPSDSPFGATSVQKIPDDELNYLELKNRVQVIAKNKKYIIQDKHEVNVENNIR